MMAEIAEVLHGQQARVYTVDLRTRKYVIVVYKTICVLNTMYTYRNQPLTHSGSIISEHRVETLGHRVAPFSDVTFSRYPHSFAFSGFGARLFQ